MKIQKQSPLALAILALVYEEPMHPYRMQQLIRDRGKDEVINVRHRASLYHIINQLVEHGLVTVQKTSRDENHPERTIYAITEEGKRTAETWLRNMLSTPAREFPEFPAALAYLPMLTPEDARDQLDKRAQKIKDTLAAIDEQLRLAGDLPRLFLVESEYIRAMLAMELTWIRSLSDDLQSGRLTWNEKWLREIAEKFKPDEE